MIGLRGMHRDDIACRMHVRWVCQGLALFLCFGIAVSTASAQSWPSYPSASPMTPTISPYAATNLPAEQDFAAASPLESFPAGWAQRLEVDGDSPTYYRSSEPWCLEVLPDGLIYRSYLAGAKEPRFASQWVHETNHGWIWDIALGGRAGILRYGTDDPDHPEGWQLDMEGAGLPRLDMENDRELVSADFRFGVPITYGKGRYQTKFGYYHLSSHLGDEFMVRYPAISRKNYSRDVLIWGHSFYPTENVRLYGEAGWAFYSDDGSKPWEFQVGLDYSPARYSGIHGDPFFAINGHLREDVDFGGNLVVQAGWQWRGHSGHLFRMGMHYFTGMSEQFEFYDEYEDKVGFGIWYDY